MADLQSAAAEDSAGRRACDQCRLRKIRCDKDWPCSNCRIAKRSCTSTGVGQRPKEPRARVLISSQYERKIDQIEGRLGNIEVLLQKLVSSQPIAPVHPLRSQAHTPSTTAAASSASHPTASSAADCDTSDDESGYGGDEGLTAHTAFASDFLERAVKRTSLREVNPKVEAALANLSQLVEMQKHRSISSGPRFPLQVPIPPGGLSKMPMPPLDVVVGLLKQNKGKRAWLFLGVPRPLTLSDTPLTIFTITCSLTGITDFTAMCRLVYFPSDDFSDAYFTIVNAGLYNLFMEQQVLAQDPVLKDQYDAHMKLCRSNLETSLANLPLFLSPKTENVMALHMGSMYAVDVSRPSVAWHLTSTAAQLCQTGGYHRVECLKDDPPELVQLKKILFWNVYTMDKGLGLRLGRSSVINDCDINLPMEVTFEDSSLLNESSIPVLWVKTSALQSRIYEQLYSPGALAELQPERIRRARLLAVEFDALQSIALESRERELEELRKRNMSEFVEVFMRGDEVQFHVTKALVYRAIPAPEGSVTRFCDECIDSARKAMYTHQSCIHLLDTSVHLRSMYVHWNLMLTPFAPFFILFCYVIETSSLEDMKIIQDFVTSLEKIRDASEAVEKLYRLFQVMCDAAVLYVESRLQQQQDDSMVPIGDEFEMYLSQLGFMPGEDQTMTNTMDTAGPVQGQGPGAQIADWFSGNRIMMGLLEEDLSQIDPSSWTQPGPM